MTSILLIIVFKGNVLCFFIVYSNVLIAVDTVARAIILIVADNCTISISYGYNVTHLICHIEILSAVTVILKIKGICSVSLRKNNSVLSIVVCSYTVNGFAKSLTAKRYTVPFLPNQRFGVSCLLCFAQFTRFRHKDMNTYYRLSRKISLTNDFNSKSMKIAIFLYSHRYCSYQKENHY